MGRLCDVSGAHTPGGARLPQFATSLDALIVKLAIHCMHLRFPAADASQEGAGGGGAQPLQAGGARDGGAAPSGGGAGADGPCWLAWAAALLLVVWGLLNAAGNACLHASRVDGFVGQGARPLAAQPACSAVQLCLAMLPCLQMAASAAEAEAAGAARLPPQMIAGFPPEMYQQVRAGGERLWEWCCHRCWCRGGCGRGAVTGVRVEWQANAQL